MKRIVWIVMIMLLLSGAVTGQGEAELGVAGTLTNGIVFEGQFESEDDMHLYTFLGAEGDFVTVQMVGDEIDPALVLLGVDNTLVGWNDDSNDELNATVELSLPYTGIYFVLATTYRSLYEWAEVEGDYQLVLNGVSDIDSSRGLTIDDLQALSPDEVTAFGNLNFQTPVLLSTLTVQDSLTVDLLAQGTDADTVLYVFDMSGKRVALDDDSGGDFSAALQGVPLDEPGQYMIMVVTRGYERENERGNINGAVDLAAFRS